MELRSQLFQHGEGPCTCIGIPVMMSTNTPTISTDAVAAAPQAPPSLLAFAQCRVGIAWGRGDGCFVATPKPGNSSACHGTCIVLKRSIDGGRTWSPLSVVANPAFSLMPVLDAVHQRVVLVYNAGPDVSNPPFIQSTSQLFVTVAGTVGPEILSPRTWSAARQIAQFPHGWASVPGPNTAVQLVAPSHHAGRLVFAGWLNNTGETCQVVVFHSDDGGASFEASRNASGGWSSVNGSCEVGLASLDDGQLLLLGNDGASFDKGPCKGDTLLHAMSSDGGDSFSAPQCDAALFSAGCQASVLSTSTSRGHSGGPGGRSRSRTSPQQLLVSNPEGAYFNPPLPQGGRSGMTVHSSGDGATTWQRLNLTFKSSAGVNGTWAGYSSLVNIPLAAPSQAEGEVGLAWETAGPGDTCFGERCRVVFSVFRSP